MSLQDYFIDLLVPKAHIPRGHEIDGKRMLEASAWNAERAKEIIAGHVGLEGPMLPILHVLQEEFGCVCDAAVPLIAEALNLTPCRGAWRRDLLSRFSP